MFEESRGSGGFILFWGDAGGLGGYDNTRVLPHLPMKSRTVSLPHCCIRWQPPSRFIKCPNMRMLHKEMMKDGVMLKLIWLECCEQCLAAGETPYQSTRFNKYYSEYIAKTNATMHLNHKPSEIIQLFLISRRKTVVKIAIRTMFDSKVHIPHSTWMSLRCFVYDTHSSIDHQFHR